MEDVRGQIGRRTPGAPEGIMVASLGKIIVRLTVVSRNIVGVTSPKIVGEQPSRKRVKVHTRKVNAMYEK